MRKLLEFLLEGMADTDKFFIEERKEDDILTFLIHAEPEVIGLIIGKKGRTIKSIRNLLKVRATLEKKAVGVSVVEKSDQPKD